MKQLVSRTLRPNKEVCFGRFMELLNPLLTMSEIYHFRIAFSVTIENFAVYLLTAL
jgi:hypothetical protein